MKLIEIFLEALFPSNIYCICCDNIIDGTRPYSLCDACVRNLRWANGSTCEKCGKILGEGHRHAKCNDCMETDHFFEKGFACVEYGMYEKILLKDYKYHGKPYLGDKLAELMHDRFSLEGILPDLLIPVPMHPKKERKRGYNQATLLAKGMGRRMGTPWEDKILSRSRATKPMNNLTPQDRRDNVKEAFTLRPGKGKMIQDKCILLVDDIFTTGSTLDECSRILLENGAKKVYMICFASGANRSRTINLTEEDSEFIDDYI